MIDEARRDPKQHVARGADIETDTTLGKANEKALILDGAHAVHDAVGPQQVEGVDDVFRPGKLAGMRYRLESGFARYLKGSGELSRGVGGLVAIEAEGDHTGLGALGGDPGYAYGLLRSPIAVGGHDESEADAVFDRRETTGAQYDVNCLTVASETPAEQPRPYGKLKPDDAITGGIGKDLVNHALDHRSVVEDTGRGNDSVTKGSERAEAGWHRGIEPSCSGQLGERRTAHTAVEVEMQMCLGKTGEIAFGETAHQFGDASVLTFRPVGQRLGVELRALTPRFWEELLRVCSNALLNGRPWRSSRIV